MKRVRYLFTVFVLLLLCDLFLLAGSSQPQCFAARELDVNTVSWNRLFYKTKTLLGEVAIDVQLKSQPADEAEQSLIATPKGQVLQTSDSDLFSITVGTLIEPLIGSTEYVNNKAWYDPLAASVLQRIRLRRGQEKWQKTYRFTNKGVYRLRKMPSGRDESNLPLERWTNVEEAFYPYSLRKDGCLRVLEPSVLLYLVSAIDFTLENASQSICVFNKKQLHTVKFQKAGLKWLKVSYAEKSGETAIHRHKEIDSVRISFKTRSLAEPNQEVEAFSFLGLKGDFDIYIDKTSGIPVQVSGKIPGIGKVDIKLSGVELRKINR